MSQQGLGGLGRLPGGRSTQVFNYIKYGNSIPCSGGHRQALGEADQEAPWAGSLGEELEAPAEPIAEAIQDLLNRFRWLNEHREELTVECDREPTVVTTRDRAGVARELEAVGPLSKAETGIVHAGEEQLRAARLECRGFGPPGARSSVFNRPQVKL
jgi:hypothetical protein